MNRNCPVCNLPEELYAQIVEARIGMSSAPEITHQTMSNWLESRGHPVKAQAILDHFKYQKRGKGHIR